MTYPSWEPRHKVGTISPGKLDLFVVTLINGRRAAIQPIMEYDAALAAARALFAESPCQIKVLPMTGTEVFNLLGIKPDGTPAPADAEDRKLVRDTLMQVARHSNDGDARADAFNQLAEMGVMER